MKMKLPGVYRLMCTSGSFNVTGNLLCYLQLSRFAM